jgi:hypothetical protein
MTKIAMALLGFTVVMSRQSLKKIGVIDLPGPKGHRFGYLTMDDEDHYGPPRSRSEESLIPRLLNRAIKLESPLQ